MIVAGTPSHGYGAHEFNAGSLLMQKLLKEAEGHKVDGDKASALLEKGELEENIYPYIGLAGISDYKSFWAKMEAGSNNGAINIGESYGIRALDDMQNL